MKAPAVVAAAVLALPAVALPAAAVVLTHPPVDRAIVTSSEWSVPLDANGQTIIDGPSILNCAPAPAAACWDPYDVVGVWINVQKGADFCKAQGPLQPNADVTVTCFNVLDDGTVVKAANRRVIFDWWDSGYTSDAPTTLKVVRR